MTRTTVTAVTHEAARPEMPPGRSDTVVTNRTRRVSAARPRSITRPSTGTSMFPPHRGTTTFFSEIYTYIDRFNINTRGIEAGDGVGNKEGGGDGGRG